MKIFKPTFLLFLFLFFSVKAFAFTDPTHIDELDESQRIYLIKLIDSDKTSDVLTELDEDVREKILKTLSPKEIAW